ncbi:Nicotinate-nucleotide--dimethylbenzimidazole phosphoribosyltransferase [Rosistilla ulvae]|uniref:Nicotinate-nucleotide--dimethylbenzimidazole phosphoribosyltransferase n=1 Tax=Rosistilla ulvae TaxID=1930277 RepID=A0A517M8B3_9BACT|nr:nicotinate-nucleotide--dimethylbenzimidazole phosphoribosyltransferase [Rosistilla ulvae]QDS91122.1 Nicotinate-nucleotide--dimethylbenzimidazole phosphoribosyltransferase [Rosistilla ulvae]
MTNNHPHIDSDAIRSRLAELCKPPESLGMIEFAATRLCETQQTLQPQTRPRQVTVFAADHGVTCEGVTAWPSEVTGAVVKVMQSHRTASGVFARSLDASYEVVDVGLLQAIAPSDEDDVSTTCLRDNAGRRGTGNLMREPAMGDADFDHAWAVGVERAEAAIAENCQVLIGGEMGIGNTTSATCLIGLLCESQIDSSVAEIVGRGAGLDDRQLSQKQQVVIAAIERVRRMGTPDAKQIGCEVGGLEIVALAGFYARAAQAGRTLLIDGMIATSAAVLADAIHPGTRCQMIAGHRSTEPAHAAALAKLQLTPILDLQMRLGEATGAIAALPILDLAAAMLCEMATLGELDL